MKKKKFTYAVDLTLETSLSVAVSTCFFCLYKTTNYSLCPCSCSSPAASASAPEPPEVVLSYAK